MNCIVIGNCQSVTFANTAGRMVPGATFRHHETSSLNEDFGKILAKADVAFVQPNIYDRLPANAFGKTRIIRFPRCSFSGFHPDIMYLHYDGRRCISHASHHSALIFGAWWHGLDQEQTAGLFNGETFERLRFPRHFEASKKGLLDEWALCGLNGEKEFERWMGLPEPFMLTMNHPTLEVMIDAAKATLLHNGFKIAENFSPPYHHLLDFATMPVYPDIASRYGQTGSIHFISNKVEGVRQSYDIQTFIAKCFDLYGKKAREKFSAEKVTQGIYNEFFSKIPKNAAAVGTGYNRHPYRNLPSHQKWRKSFTDFEISDVDPVVDCGFKIQATDKVATAGSCFAQHLAKALERSGLCYYAPEAGDRELGYGLYSARYGNIYTPAQLNQLLDRAYGRFEPVDTAWHKGDGTFVDPFRPEIPQVTAATMADVAEDRAAHFGYVREVFEKMDYFVFTLGLTEAWRSRIDGAVFPLAPGVAAGAMDPDKYEFVNFGVTETTADLSAAIRKIREVNPGVKIILTVSPVPLMATYVPRHVLLSTTYSKSVLRVAAEEIRMNFPDVHYFPSYEIITGSYNRGAYYKKDYRTVTQEGVNHVMKLFLKHGTSVHDSEDEQMRRIREDYDIFCAEEMLDAGDNTPLKAPGLFRRVLEMATVRKKKN
ncbi:GSCFA domain-containing protein [Luteolibacter yonseiensis]|uniref:GSCFA domain-containing protein n=3 Tax=Luteolibacter yonseiensis TaxID=1144680 RepID=A0A934R8V9_9BACT|nr:GSCFA domain-containing protein [Luteolibacter yonseiensis]